MPLRRSLFALILLCGCGGSDYEQVSYAPPPLVGPVQTIAVADARAGIAAAAAPRIAFAGSVKRNAPLVFEGRCKPSNSERSGGSVNVNFYAAPANGERVIIGGGMAAVAPSGDGWLKYRVELYAPPDSGKCAVEILQFGDLVALGEVMIE